MSEVTLNFINKYKLLLSIPVDSHFYDNIASHSSPVQVLMLTTMIYANRFYIIVSFRKCPNWTSSGGDSRSRFSFCCIYLNWSSGSALTTIKLLSQQFNIKTKQNRKTNKSENSSSTTWNKDSCCRSGAEERVAPYSPIAAEGKVCSVSCDCWLLRSIRGLQNGRFTVHI